MPLAQCHPEAGEDGGFVEKVLQEILPGGWQKPGQVPRLG